MDIIYLLGFTVQRLKVCRTLGPTACSQVTYIIKASGQSANLPVDQRALRRPLHDHLHLEAAHLGVTSLGTKHLSFSAYYTQTLNSLLHVWYSAWHISVSHLANVHNNNSSSSCTMIIHYLGDL